MTSLLRSLAIAAVAAASLGSITDSHASPVAEAGFATGAVWPQGTYTNFADPGPTFRLRFTYHVPGAESLIGWANLSYTEFRTNRSAAYLDVPAYYGPSVRLTTEEAWVLQVGPQIGSPTSKGFFRPRAGVGIGFHAFNRDDKYEYLDSFDEVASYPGDNGLLVGRFGWTGVVGTDLFFVPRWGISVDFLYDHIWNAHRKSPAMYNGVIVGVVFPINQW